MASGALLTHLFHRRVRCHGNSLMCLLFGLRRFVFGMNTSQFHVDAVKVLDFYNPREEKC